ncbi:MAG TPA: hypothetical protein VK425_08555 [Acidimicrobiales bacterium]|nr:hypothetical protein [Acidimicrobiales bacterium]
MADISGPQLDRSDFLRKFVRVDRQLVRVHAALAEFRPPKTTVFVTVRRQNMRSEAAA